jgi:hypothetical protein
LFHEVSKFLSEPAFRKFFDHEAERHARSAIIRGIDVEIEVQEESPMKAKLLIAGVAVAAFATPALADFWIVRDTPTAQCRIVETRPTDTKIIIVGGNKVYKTRADAEKELAVVCKAN